MPPVYECRNEVRRERVRGVGPDGVAWPVVANGIDYLEVDPDDQQVLIVRFLHPLPGEAGGVPAAGPALTAASVRVEGGVRIRDVAVTNVASAGDTLTVTVDRKGDFSTYTLRLVDPGKNATPPEAPPPPLGFDPPLSAVEFSFKANCPSEFDCQDVHECPPDVLPSPSIDYLAKDYASFRRLMLDRLSAAMPGWRERSPADLVVTLTELLAYVGDHLSYAQDSVGTEMYLGTARRRVSVRRHARLLDYRMHDGCNARAWVVLTLAAGAAPFDVPASTPLLAGGAGSAPAVSGVEAAASALGGVPGFETLHPLRAAPGSNAILLHTWSDTECCLVEGATSATLVVDPAEPPQLEAGRVLIFEELMSPTTGRAEDADRSHRHAVRLSRVGVVETDPVEGKRICRVDWADADALPFPLCVSATVDGTLVSPVSVARGNVIAVHHGFRVGPTLLPPPSSAETTPLGRYRPTLDDTGATQWEEYDVAAPPRPAAQTLVQDPARALPRIGLTTSDGKGWKPRRDLVGVGPFAEQFVGEMESDGMVTLRFGDGVHGRRPLGDSPVVAEYHLGNGRAGNVGAESITTIALDDAVQRARVISVRNPMPAEGGIDAETSEQVRQYAPQAFRRQERAVTEEDYARTAEEYEGVQRAAATLRWTGSWYTMFVTVDRVGGGSATRDPAFAAGLRAWIERRRLAGYDLELSDPVLVPLDIRMLVCAREGFFNADVKQALLAALGRGMLGDGTRGFFHPDNFTFGVPLHLSNVVERALLVPGVASVEFRVFQRWGGAPNREIEDGLIRADRLEVLQLDNDPNFPERGRIEFDVRGGL